MAADLASLQARRYNRSVLTNLLKRRVNPRLNRPRGRPVRCWKRCSRRVRIAAGATAAALLGCLLLPIHGAEPLGKVRWHIRDSDSRERLPARVHLRDPAGQPVRPSGFAFWHDHFVTEGSFELPLAPGQYRYEIERGPEYRSISGAVAIASANTTSLTNDLPRLAHLATEGWWSGDLHVHRPLRDVELLMRAEDLHVAPIITWWNSRGPWATNPPPTTPVVRFDGNRYFAPLAGEDERGGGALLFFGLPRPLPLDGLAREYPSSTSFLRQAGEQPGAWVDLEKPFWWDVPIWLATGLADSVGVANNHQNRSGMLDNEAWGRPRDSRVYPGPKGNGHYSQDLYYQILNAGIRLPPSAGSASGVLPNPVGYNRVYVQVDGELTWEKWWDGLRAGRVFVGNGPLLRLRANGQWPGATLRADGTLSVTLDGRLDSRDPIAAVELVRDGHVQRVTLPAQFEIQESGWFLIRAVADVPGTFRFASTGPWFVEVDGKPSPIRRDAVRFFLDWTRERKAAVSAAVTDPSQRSEALAPVDQAEAFWRGRLDSAR